MRAVHSMNQLDSNDKLMTDVDSSDEAGFEDKDKPVVMAAPTDDPQVLLALQKQYDAIPHARYELRPARAIGPAAIDTLHAKIARFASEYAILSRCQQQFLCISYSHEAALQRRAHEGVTRRDRWAGVRDAALRAL